MENNQKTEQQKELFKTQQYDIFTIVENYNEGVEISICLGNYLIENGFDSVELAKEYINSKPYKLIIAIASISAKVTTETIKKEEKNEK